MEFAAHPILSHRRLTPSLSTLSPLCSLKESIVYYSGRAKDVDTGITASRFVRLTMSAAGHIVTRNELFEQPFNVSL